MERARRLELLTSTFGKVGNRGETLIVGASFVAGPAEGRFDRIPIPAIRFEPVGRGVQPDHQPREAS